MLLNLSNMPSIGEVIAVKFKGASFNARVINARIRYGNVDALVEPVNGSGQFWTVYTKVTVKAPPATPEAYHETSAIDDIVQEVIDEELEEASASIIE